MTIYINESCGSCFAGFIGEHLATEAVFSVPERIAGCDYYRVAFGVNDTVIRTEELTPAEGESSAVRVLLWQELTLNKTLTATLEGYIGDRYIGKGAQATLRFERAVGGDESEADTDPHGMQLEVAENTKARHTHENKGDVLDELSRDNDTLLWLGSPIEGGTVDIPFYNDASDLPETGTLALVRTESPLYDPYIFEIGQEFDRLYINPELITPWEESGLDWSGGSLGVTTGTELPLPQVILFIGENQWTYFCCPFNGLITIGNELWRVDGPKGWMEVEVDPTNHTITGIPIDFSEIPELTDIEITSSNGDIGYFISPYPYPQHNNSATLYAYDEETQEWRSVEGFENLYKLVIGNTDARHTHPNPDILNSFYMIDGQVYLGGIALGIKIEEVDSEADLSALDLSVRQAIVKSESEETDGDLFVEGEIYDTVYVAEKAERPLIDAGVQIGSVLFRARAFNPSTWYIPVGWEIRDFRDGWHYWYLPDGYDEVESVMFPITEPIPQGWYKQEWAGQEVIPISYSELPDFDEMGRCLGMTNPRELSKFISPTPYQPAFYYTLFTRNSEGIFVPVSDPKIKSLINGLADTNERIDAINERTEGVEVVDGELLFNGEPIAPDIPLVYDESDLPESGSLAVVAETLYDGTEFELEDGCNVPFDGKYYVHPKPKPFEGGSAEMAIQRQSNLLNVAFSPSEKVIGVMTEKDGVLQFVFYAYEATAYHPEVGWWSEGDFTQDVIKVDYKDIVFPEFANSLYEVTLGNTDWSNIISPTPFTTKYTLYYYDQTTLEWVKTGADIPPEIITQIETNKTDIFDLRDDVGGINDVIEVLDPIVRDNESKLITLTAKQTLTANGTLTIDLSNGSHCFISVEGDVVITLTSSDLTPFCLYFSNPDECEVTITDAEYMQGVAPRILSENYQMVGDFETVPKIAGVIECVVCEEE